ncbi:alanine acetyltransferase [Bacillus coahuilensis m2-6]|uniref:Alanine acetyltransferase n=1 Tax=Bacillus coahuilensis p1.1.43 TaxID=1150625 RepID=A0A147K6S9_9BACI|nr:GNAT family N-acetyltransferase [Bacillus coahuilensis]KUP05758.1 alanine acetyltransferase [Bacillus coahuilensis p1.1.43]KUP06793.1 alanine acetyltransferase [Bacillus coahuilensis m2-6]
MKAHSIIELESYRLSPLEQSHHEQLYPILRDRSTMKYITPHPVQTIEECYIKIRQYIENNNKEKEVSWVIMKRDSSTIIGLFRLHSLNLWHQKAKLGVIIHPQYQQKGVMNEIFPAILDYVFHELRLNRLVGDIFCNNEGSKRILEKHGFKLEGTLRETDFDGEVYYDTAVYSLLRKEYVPIN